METKSSTAEINVEEVKRYKDRIRILLIIYFFSDNYQDLEAPQLVKLLKGEGKIQKLDFLLRYPDYFAYELLEKASEEEIHKTRIKKIVKFIFDNNEPSIRKDEMERFFYGAWEDIDDTISFLKSIQFIEFKSKKFQDGRIGNKHYFLTQLAKEKIEKGLNNIDAFKWYIDRCQLIKQYFGDLSGYELRIQQYKHKEYENTPYKEYIKGIEEKVINRFAEIYNTPLK